MIRDSDQGKSFRAFWELLMSDERQRELQRLLDRLYSLEEIKELDPDPLLARIRYLLLDAGEKVYQTSNLLVEQLRKYLDDRAYLENRRIMEIIREIEKRALAVKDEPPPGRDFIFMDELSPRIELPLSRSLFTVPRVPVIEDRRPGEGSGEIAIDALYEQVHVDERVLADRVRTLLQEQGQVSLARVVERFPVEKGVAEIVTYLNLAEKNPRAMVSDKDSEEIVIRTSDGKTRLVRVPQVIFT